MEPGVGATEVGREFDISESTVHLSLIHISHTHTHIYSFITYIIF